MLSGRIRRPAYSTAQVLLRLFHSSIPVSYTHLLYPGRRTRKRLTGTHLARPRTTSTGATVPGNDGNTIVFTFRRQNKRHRPLHFSPPLPNSLPEGDLDSLPSPKGCYVVYISICMLRDDKRTNSEFEIRYTTIRPTLTHLTIFHSPQKNNQGKLCTSFP